MILLLKIKIGRSLNADIDVSSYQMDKKVSRDQCTINVIDTNKFVLLNNGKLPIFVDGKILINKCKTQIYDKSIIEVSV